MNILTRENVQFSLDFVSAFFFFFGSTDAVQIKKKKKSLPSQLCGANSPLVLKTASSVEK